MTLGDCVVCGGTRVNLGHDVTQGYSLDQGGDCVVRREGDRVFWLQVNGTSGSDGLLAYRSSVEARRSRLAAQPAHTFREQPALDHGGIKLFQLGVANQRAAGGDGRGGGRLPNLTSHGYGFLLRIE